MKRLSRWMICFLLALPSAILHASVANPLSDSLSQLTNPPGNINPSSTDAFGFAVSGEAATLQVTIAQDPANVYLPTRSDANARANTRLYRKLVFSAAKPR